jgi:hypothetical protein
VQVTLSSNFIGVLSSLERQARKPKIPEQYQGLARSTPWVVA